MKIPNINEILSDYPEFTGIHPIADCFPMQSADDFLGLVDNIREYGVEAPLLREKGTGLLVDGRNRLLAISITDSLFSVEDVDPASVLCRVLSRNIHCKQFTTDQKAMVAAELRPFYDKEAKDRQGTRTDLGNIQEKIPESNKSQSRDAAGAAVGVNGKYVDKATQVLQASPPIAEEVKQGRVKLADAHKQVKPVIAAAKAEEKANKPESKQKKKKIAVVVAADGRKTEIPMPSKPTFNETNDSVSWAKWTWNPVTGCEHGCKFCYAREIAHSPRMAAVYPFEFAPAFHDYRLPAPKNTKRVDSEDSRDGRVFVCSMADLFGKWVPDTWIRSVFAACAESPEWEYMFLTKWPKRYNMLSDLPKAWFGASIIRQADVDRVTRDMTAFTCHGGITRWVSLEPMLEPITFGDLSWCDLMVIGAQTSTTQPDGFVPAFKPKFEWVADVVAQCRDAGVPYYLKENLMEEAPGMEMPRMEPRT